MTLAGRRRKGVIFSGTEQLLVDNPRLTKWAGRIFADRSLT